MESLSAWHTQAGVAVYMAYRTSICQTFRWTCGSSLCTARVPPGRTGSHATSAVPCLPYCCGLVWGKESVRELDSLLSSLDGWYTKRNITQRQYFKSIFISYNHHKSSVKEKNKIKRSEKSRRNTVRERERVIQTERPRDRVGKRKLQCAPTSLIDNYIMYNG